MNCISCHDTDVMQDLPELPTESRDNGGSYIWLSNKLTTDFISYLTILQWQESGSPLYSYSYRDERCSKSVEYSAIQRSVMDGEQWTRMHWIGVRRSFMIACERNVTEWWCLKGHRTKHINYITCHSNGCNFSHLLLEIHHWPASNSTWLVPSCDDFSCLVLSCLL